VNRYTVLYKTLGPIVGRPYECKLVSLGGVGSTALGRHMWSTNDKTSYEHAFSPKIFTGHPQLRLGYMYGDPYNAVLSVFRRGYQEMHIQAMHRHTGIKPRSLAGVTLEQYLAEGRDQFGLEAQFDRWTGGEKAPAPLILIKYEGLSEGIGDVLNFFGVRKPFAVRSRKSDWESQPEAVRRGLETIYGRLREKVLAMPSVKII
jgi:hypothetical protein